MKPFYVADLTTQGELRQIAEYDYAALERIGGAIDVISRCSCELWKNPEEMEAQLSDSGQTLLRWRSTAPTAGIATVRRADQQLVSLSLLAAGHDPAADASTLQAAQTHIVRELRQTAFEPAFDLIHIKQHHWSQLSPSPTAAPTPSKWSKPWQTAASPPPISDIWDSPENP